jgi:hypothetical protein
VKGSGDSTVYRMCLAAGLLLLASAVVLGCLLAANISSSAGQG